MKKASTNLVDSVAGSGGSVFLLTDYVKNTRPKETFQVRALTRSGGVDRKFGRGRPVVVNVRGRTLGSGLETQYSTGSLEPSSNGGFFLVSDRVVANSFGKPQYRITAYTARGWLDRSFGVSGTALMPRGGPGIVRLRDGRWRTCNPSTGRIIGLTAGGRTDHSLGSAAVQGSRSPLCGTSWGAYRWIGSDSSGRIYAATYAFTNSGEGYSDGFAVRRVYSNGRPDTRYGGAGTALVRRRDPRLYTFAPDHAVVLASGAVMVAGAKRSEGVNPIDPAVKSGMVFILKLTSAGRPDTRFGPAGVHTYKISKTTARDAYGDALLPLSDGRVVVTLVDLYPRHTYDQPTPLMEVNAANGRRYTTFGTLGIVKVPKLADPTGSGRGLLAGPRDRFLVASDVITRIPVEPFYRHTVVVQRRIA